MIAVVFDIDGTLLSTSGAGRDAMYQAIEDLFGVRLPDGTVPFAGCTDRSILNGLAKAANAPLDEATFTRIKARYLELLPKMLERDTARILPGIEPLLEALSASGRYAVGLLTGNLDKLVYFPGYVKA